MRRPRESAALAVHDAFLTTKNNGTLHDVLDQMNATWREKLGGGDGAAENTPEHVRRVADFNQRYVSAHVSWCSLC
jgi:hypothetical protein